MLVSLEGKMGSGMSMAAVAFASEEYFRKGRKPLMEWAITRKYEYLTEKDFLDKVFRVDG